VSRLAYHYIIIQQCTHTKEL